jgi:hypothetical protein
MHLSDLVGLAHVCEPEKSKLLQLYTAHESRILAAPGSQIKHQAWVGGYLDHINDCCQIAVKLYEPLNSYRTLPFTIHDVMIVLLIHDLEKPFKYVIPKIKIGRNDAKDYVLDLISKFDLKLTPEQLNAFTYIHGEGDDYSPTVRVQNELGAFCHCCDTLSARVFYDKPSGS